MSETVGLECSYLPGVLTLGEGTRGDYAALERFHYIARRPATWAGVWAVRHAQDAGTDAHGRVVAVAVLSWPVPCVKGRQEWFGMKGWSFARQLSWANANLRTISRVIVHPQFRGIGLASLLVRHVLAHCPTRYCEALAAMGRVHPFFEQAGMQRVGDDYFVASKSECSNQKSE